MVAYGSNKKALVQGFSMGGTGLEPVNPQLVDSGRPFAPVRSNRIVEPNAIVSERLSEPNER